MSDARRTSSEIERDVERTRSDVDETIHELKDRFSPDSAVEYGMSYMRGPGGQRLLGAIRDNPLAAVLALTGIGWLLYTANRATSTRPISSGPSEPLTTEPQVHRHDPSRPGMMGDGTQEQNLNEPGSPAARITRQEVEAAFREEQGSDDLRR